MTDIAVPTTAVTPASPPVKRLLTLDLGADNNLLTGFGTGDALPTPTTGLSPDTAAISPSNSPKRDYSSASYRESLATALRWDPQRQELYLQLPSYPELRLTPFREGIEDDLVTLFNHPSVGERLYRLPYPMNRQYAAEWVENDLHHHEEFCTALRAGVLDMPDDAEAETKPLEPHHDVIILGLPFKSLWDTTQNRIIGDIGLSPDLEPLTPGGPPRTEEQVRASPLSSQTWHLGYVLEPAANGRGIMSEVIGVLLESWVRPLMRIERVVAIIENNNKGSSIVVHRHGFKRVRDIVTDWPEEKGGGKRYSGYYIWKRGGDGSDDERVMRNLHNRHKAARAAVEFSSDEDGSEEEDGDGDDDGDNAADTSMLTPAANSEEDVQMHSPA